MFDVYMQIGDGSDVKGEATASGLEGDGWIELAGFTFGAKNPTTVGTHSKGLTGGKAELERFTVKKRTELSSAKLFSACCTGQHYDKVKVVLRKSTGTSGVQQNFLEIDFSDVLIEKITWVGEPTSENQTPEELVHLAFAKVEISYKTQGADGSMSDGSTASWDVTKAALS